MSKTAVYFFAGKKYSVQGKYTRVSPSTVLSPACLLHNRRKFVSSSFLLYFFIHQGGAKRILGYFVSQISCELAHLFLWCSQCCLTRVYLSVQFLLEVVPTSRRQLYPTQVLVVPTSTTPGHLTRHFHCKDRNAGVVKVHVQDRRPTLAALL